MRTQHRGESAIRIIFAKKHKWYVSVFPIPDHFSRIVCPFWTGSSYRTVQSPITPPFLTAQRSNRTAYCLFTRQDLPQKIPSLQIQFCGRKSCKICKKIFYFFAFVGMYKTAILFLCNFHRNIRKKIWFFLKKAFSFSFFYGIIELCMQFLQLRSSAASSRNDFSSCLAAERNLSHQEEML